eukprot:4540292-Prymnesium_polylepis.1
MHIGGRNWLHSLDFFAFGSHQTVTIGADGVAKRAHESSVSLESANASQQCPRQPWLGPNEAPAKSYPLVGG